MNIDRKGVQLSHILTTLGMAAGAIVWIIGYAEDFSAVRTQQKAIEQKLDREREIQQERYEDARERDARQEQMLQQIQQTQMQMLQRLQ